MKKILCFATLPFLLAAGPASSATTGWNETAAGTYDYNDPSFWVSNTINGIFDSSLTLAGTQNIVFNADTPLSGGLTFNFVGGSILLRGNGGDRTVTLGGDISTTRSINLGSSTANQALILDLGGTTRNLTVQTGITLGFINPIQNGGLVISGGTVNFSGANTYSGATTINTGAVSLNGQNGGSANSDFLVNANPGSNVTLTFNSSTAGVTGTTRAKSVSLNAIGSTAAGNTALIVTGNSTASSVDTITNALSNTGGFATVTVSAGTNRDTTLAAGSFSRTAGTTTLFRGTNLGMNSPGSGTTTGYVTFATAPTLSGGTGANGTDQGILVGTFGDTASGGTGLGATGGLLTYDPVRGVTPVSSYKTSITSGQTQLDNIRYTNTTGSGVITTNLTADTTVNSISFDISGTGTDGGVVISGDPGTRLTVNSGMIYAKQLATLSNQPSNSPVISVPILDLAGGEGHIISATSGITSTRSGGVVEISSEITNDGGNGLTIGGSGIVKFTGSTSNSYTGLTTVNSGVLLLAKSSSANAITGDIVINGGTVESANNQIADTSNITINRGSFKLQIGNEGNSRNESFNNLTMNGGSYATGSAGHNGVTNVLGDAVLNGGSINVVAQADFNVAGETTFSGTAMTIQRSHAGTNTFDTNVSFDGGITLVNTASGAYTPITVNPGETANNRVGGRMILSSNLSFVGNGTNTNTVTIDAPTGAGPQGIIALSGTRTFTIGNGAAAQDLTVVAPLTNHGVTVGGLVKAGAGTMLVQGINTYTGDTTVSEGRLQLGSAASIASTLIDIQQDGIYDTTSQSFAMTNGQGFKFTLDSTAGGSAGLLEAGVLDITNGVVDFDTIGTLNDTYYIIASYSSLTGTAFASVTDLPSGYTLEYNYLGGNDIAVVAVPEPSAGLMMLAGAACLIAVRRLRSSRTI